MNYVRLNQDGIVIEYGSCQDEAFPHIPVSDGQTLVPVEAHPVDSHERKIRYENGQFVDVGSWKTLSYADNRRAEYPAVGDQMDAMWHAMDAGTLPRIEPFYSQIKAVKERFPKE